MSNEAIKFTREDFEDFVSNHVWSRIRQLLKDNMALAESILHDDTRDEQRFVARADIRAGLHLLSITEIIEQELIQEEKHG